MNKKTLTALKKSIQKWGKNCRGSVFDTKLGPDDCPLCALFNRGENCPSCLGCPVLDSTGRHGCAGTPYDECEKLCSLAYALKQSSSCAKELVQDLWEAAAEREYEFLKSLLPASEKKTTARRSR